MKQLHWGRMLAGKRTRGGRDDRFYLGDVRWFWEKFLYKVLNYYFIIYRNINSNYIMLTEEGSHRDPSVNLDFSRNFRMLTEGSHRDSSVNLDFSRVDHKIDTLRTCVSPLQGTDTFICCVPPSAI